MSTQPLHAATNVTPLRGSTLTANGVAFLFFAGWQAMTPFVALQATSLGASPAAVGAILGGQSLGPLLLAIPLGLTTERWGAGKVMLAGSLAGTVIIAMGPTLVVLTVGLILLGIAQLAIAAATQIETLLGTTVECRDRAIGVYFFVISLGQISGPVVGGLLVNDIEYQRAFLGGAALCGGAALTAVGAARRRLQETGGLHVPVRATLILGLRRTGEARAALLTSLTAELVVAFWYAFFPLLLRGKGFGAGTIAFAFSLRGASTAAVRPLLGRLTAHIPRGWILCGSTSLLMLSIWLMPAIRSSWSLTLVVVAFGASAGLVFPLTMAEVAAGFPLEDVGLGVGARQLMIRIGQVLGPGMMGMVTQAFGIPVAFLTAGLTLLATTAYQSVQYMKRPGISTTDRMSRDGRGS